MTPLSNRLTLGFSAVGHTYSHLFTLLYATAVLAIARDWGMGYDVLIALSLPMNVMFGLGALPAGWAADRFGALPVMLLFFLGVGGGALLTGFATTPTMILVGLTVIGTFAAIYHPVGIPWLIKHAANRGRALAVNNVFGSIGIAGAAIVAGFCADTWGWRSAFLVPGAVCIVTGLAFALFFRAGSMVEAQIDVKAEAPPAPADVKRAFIVLSVTMIMSGLFVNVVTTALPKMFEERLADDVGGFTWGIGAMVSLVYMISAAGQLLGGELMERFRLKSFYVTTMAAVAPLILLGFFVHTLFLVPVIGLALTLLSTAQLAENTLLTRYTPARWRGRAFGAKFVLSLGVGTLGVAVVPLVYRLYGNLDAAYLVMVVFAALGALAAMLMPGEKPVVAVVPAPAAAE